MSFRFTSEFPLAVRLLGCQQTARSLHFLVTIFLVTIFLVKNLKMAFPGADGFVWAPGGQSFFYGRTENGAHNT